MSEFTQAEKQRYVRIADSLERIHSRLFIRNEMKLCAPGNEFGSRPGECFNHYCASAVTNTAIQNRVPRFAQLHQEEKKEAPKEEAKHDREEENMDKELARLSKGGPKGGAFHFADAVVAKKKTVETQEMLKPADKDRAEKERKAAKLKAMQAKLKAAGLAKDEESEAERKAAKLQAMREKLAAAGLAKTDDSSEPDAAAAEAARKAAKLQAMREKLAAAGLPTTHQD